MMDQVTIRNREVKEPGVQSMRFEHLENKLNALRVQSPVRILTGSSLN